jgi:peptidoglycan/LPS O-acetylase OafA/YrhL
MRIEALTFFRFLAAIIVVIFHFGISTELAEAFSPFIISGSEMVTFFFVLSGFVLMISHYNKEKETVQKFYLARIARIVPLYMLALFLTLYLENGTKDNTVSFILSMSFMQSWFPPHAMNLNIPGWSLSTEAFFYITFPLVLFIIKESKIKILTLVLTSIALYVFTQTVLSNYMNHTSYEKFPTIFHDTLYYSPLFHYCSFILGVTGGYIYVKKQSYFHKTTIFSLIIMILVFFTTYYLLQHPELLSTTLNTTLAYKSSFYALLFLIFILSIAHTHNFITKLLSFRLFTILGESSYALYILQFPIYIIYTKYISNYLNLEGNNDFYAYLIMLIGIAIMAFYLIEKPLNRLIRYTIPNHISNLKSKKLIGKTV